MAAGRPLLKNLGLIADAGHALTAPLPGAALTRELMHAAAAEWADEDYAAIIKVLERLARLPH